MLTILAIITQSGMNTDGYSPTEHTPRYYIASSKYSRLVLVLRNLSNDIFLMDFSKFITYGAKLPVNASWSQIAAMLTEELAMTYAVGAFAVPRYIRSNNVLTRFDLGSQYSNGPKIYSCQHDDGLQTHYGDKNNPAIEDSYPLRRMTKDFIVTPKTNHPIRLNQSLPVVHGISCFPTVVGNKLYAQNGGVFTQNEKDTPKGDLLIDFSPVDGVTFLPLSDCYVSGWDSIILPDGVSLKDKFTILVVHGRWYFPGEFNVLQERLISFPIDEYPSELHYLCDKLTKYEYHYNTTTVLDNSIESSRQNGFNDPNNFLIMIGDPDLRIQKIYPIYAATDEKLKFPKDIGGLLYEEHTRTFVDYTRVQYADHSMLYHPRITAIQRVLGNCANLSNNSMGLGFTHTSRNINFGGFRKDQPSYVMLDLIGSKLQR